jgi:hypothetical protein
VAAPEPSLLKDNFQSDEWYHISAVRTSFFQNFQIAMDGVVLNQ